MCKKERKKERRPKEEKLSSKNISRGRDEWQRKMREQDEKKGREKEELAL